jgi:hypothetical protein
LFLLYLGANSMQKQKSNKTTFCLQQLFGDTTFIPTTFVTTTFVPTSFRQNNF